MLTLNNASRIAGDSTCIQKKLLNNRQLKVDRRTDGQTKIVTGGQPDRCLFYLTKTVGLSISDAKIPIDKTNVHTVLNIGVKKIIVCSI